MSNEKKPTEKKFRDKAYRLLRGAPLSYVLPSRNNPKFPLLYFDESKAVNRAIRYAQNQKSPFEDEQDGNAICPPVVFENGMLVVPHTDQVLQRILDDLHPMKGIVYEEVNKERDAEQEIEILDLEFKAMEEARMMSVSDFEQAYSVIFGKDPRQVETAIMKRDVLVFSRNSPKEFLNVMNDPDLKFQTKVRKFFDERLLVAKNGDREVWFNTKANKNKMMSVPHGEDIVSATVSYFKSTEGVAHLKMLDAALAE